MKKSWLILLAFLAAQTGTALAGNCPATLPSSRGTGQVAGAPIAGGMRYYFTDADVEVTGSRTPGGDITATVTAQFHCAMGWASMVCGGGGTRQMVAKATSVYQGARYPYDGQASGPITGGGGSW